MKINKVYQSTLQYLKGNYRACEFALTNICVSKCSFCNIWKQKKKIIVDKDKAIKTIDCLADLGVRFITLTGGEPLLHPNIIDFTKRCTKRGIVTAILDADPRLFTKEKVEELKKAGLDYACISIDHYTDEIEYKSRKIKDLLFHIKNAVELLKKNKIKTIASILISNYNHTELKKLFEKCNDIGFDNIAINYPEHSLSTVYELGGNMVRLTPEQTIYALQEVIKLKKEYNIINPIDSMQNIIKYLKKERVDYLCFGGNKVLFVDWFFNVYPCMHLAKHFGPIFELTKDKLLKQPCNCCNMSWYRDFSIYFCGIKSIKPLIKEIKQF
ncbi:MAG: radical SAM protein [Candidatus Nanoarchaeia archaeon]